MDRTNVVKKPNGAIKLTKDMWKHRWLMGMLLIGITYFVIFHYGPMYGVQIAFRDYQFRSGIWGSEWVGFDNFRKMFRSRAFIDVFRNTVIISSYKLLFGFPAPIIFALLLNELKNKIFKRGIQSVSYLPHFLSWVVLGGIFKQILSPTTGTINYILNQIGIQPIYFLGNNDWFRTTLVFTSLWKEVGWGSIIYLAALSAIDPTLYEAAEIDGANRFQQAMKITIPGIMPIICIQLIFWSGSIISDDFQQIFNLYNEAVYKTGDVLGTYIYRAGLVQMQYSYTAAVGLFRNIISLVIIIIINYATRLMGDENYGIW